MFQFIVLTKGIKFESSFNQLGTHKHLPKDGAMDITSTNRTEYSIPGKSEAKVHRYDVCIGSEVLKKTMHP